MNEIPAPFINAHEIPLAPEIPTLNPPLMEDLIRRDELYSRFLVNTIGENPSLRRITDTIRIQNQIERLIEAALVQSGFNPSRILENRHRIRGILFYPRGTALSVTTYTSYLQQISSEGTLGTRLYQRILRAIHNYDLWL